MAGAMVCVAVALLGIDAGWQPAPDGGIEYIIQIEPYMLDRLRAGEDFQSDIPSELRDVRSYRITAGTGKLPRKGLPVKPPAGPPVAVPPANMAGKSQQTVPPSIAVAPPLKTETIAQRKAEGVPSPLRPGASKLLGAQTAAFDQRIAADGAPEWERTRPATVESTVWILGGIACGLFGALAYLFWIHWETRNRYRDLLDQSPVCDAPRDGSRDN